MTHKNRVLFAGFALLTTLLLTACGTFELNLSPVDDAAPGAEETDRQPKPGVEHQNGDGTEPGEAAEVVEGRVMRLFLPEGIIELYNEELDEITYVTITEETAIERQEDGLAIVIGQITRGALLEVTGSLVDEKFAARSVVMLEAGINFDDNPAYSDVTGLITPVPPVDGDAPITLLEPISLFEVSSGSKAVEPGSTVTVRWTYFGGYAELCLRQNPAPLSRTCYVDLPVSGAMDIAIPADSVGVVALDLYVHSNTQPDTVTTGNIYVPLTVSATCANDYFFSDLLWSQLLPCAENAPVTINVEAQPFERGMILRLTESWYEDGPKLVVLVEDNGQLAPTLYTEDTWAESMPAMDAVLTPPPGYFQPVNGIGLVWRGVIGEYNVMAGDVLTINGLSLIGWATEPAFSYRATYQCEGYICFLSLPDGSPVSLSSRD